jgi:hypothetical protein
MLRRGRYAGHSAKAIVRPLLEHDPEKWRPVFRKDRAQSKSWQKAGMNSKKSRE